MSLFSAALLIINCLLVVYTLWTAKNKYSFKSGAAYNRNVHNLFDKNKWKELQLTIFPATIPFRFGFEYYTVSWFSEQRSVTISILPLNTDPLIVAYDGRFEQ